MKYSKILFFFLFLLCAFIGSQEVTRANVFPFYIHVTQPNSEVPFDGNFADGTAAAIRFMIQDTVLTTNVTVLIKNGATTVKTLTLNGIKGGYHSVIWDGRNDASGVVPPGSYTIEVTAAQTTGHATYKLIFDCAQAAGLSTRGCTINNNPLSKSFGFAYGVTTPGGSFWNFNGVGRVAGNGLLFGDTLGNAQLTSTGEGLGPANRRYSPRFDSDGYVYVIGRDQREILRFHVDSLNVTILIDTIRTVGLINGIYVSGTGTSKYLWIASTTGIFGAPIGTSSVYTGVVDSLIPAPTGLQYWDVLKGDGDALYAVVNQATQLAGNGVFKFNMPTPAPHPVTDTVWYARTPQGDAVALDIWRGATNAASDDILYLTFDAVGGSMGGIFKIDNLHASPSIVLAYEDLDDNTTRTRGQVAVDYVGNLIYFENSNEQILLISPPGGANSKTFTALSPLVITTPVPVELISFAANVDGNAVQLNWLTATETNNRGFEIQRKTVEGDFVTIGFVQGNGTSTQSHSYSYTDNNAQSGSFSYRLKQMDFDGRFSYSNVVEVSINPSQFSLEQNYPNPFNPSTTINFNLAKETNVSLKVFNLLGEQVTALVNGEVLPAGVYSYKFDASSLASGTYIYRLEAGDFVQTKKMTLTK